MKYINFENRDQIVAYYNNMIRNNRNQRYMLCVVFKKFYKERSFEMNLEAYVDDTTEILSLIRTKIDESDFKKFKHILDKENPIDINDKNKKVIIYTFDQTRTIIDLFDICYKGLQDIQFSDFYA